MAMQLQEDGNGILIAGGPLIRLRMLSLFCHLSNSDSRGPRVRSGSGFKIDDPSE